MSTEDNKAATVRRAIEEGWNQGNVAVFDELCAPNWVYHEPGSPDVRTLADYKRFATETRRDFPDLHLTIEDLVAEGDKVVMRGTFGGANAYPRNWQADHHDDNLHRSLCWRKGRRSLDPGR